MEALAILFGWLFTGVTAWSLGRLLLRRDDLAPLALPVGAAALSTAVFALCALHLAYPVVFLLGGAAATVAARRRLLPAPATCAPAGTPPARLALFLLPFGVYFILYFFNAMAPEVSPDGTAYHLSLVARYLRDRGFQRITTNMYANLSQGLEMLFLFAFAFGRHSAAAMVHFAFLPILSWSVWLYGRRVGHPVPAYAAALLIFASPSIGIDAISAYNDVALAATAFGVFFLLQVWDEERDPALVPLIGLLAGFCYAIKYTGGVAVPYALGFIAWKSWRKRDPRTLRHVFIAGAAAGVLILPWMAKNWLWLGNPVSPFFNSVFPNPYVTVSFEREYKEMLSHYELASRWRLPFEVTTNGMLSGLLGPVFLLAPLALVALRRRTGRQLLLAAFVFGSLYFTNVGTRFLIPSLPFVSLALMLVLDSVPKLAIGIALLHAVLSWPSVIPRYADQRAWHLRRVPWKHALRLRPAEQYLESNLTLYRAGRLIERMTPPGSTVFTFMPVPEAYTSRNILVCYESAANKTAGAIQWTPLVPEYAPTWRLRFSFPPQPLRALRVTQMGGGTHDIWTIHEFRVYDGRRELPRAPRWRLSANSYPWDIQYAFDNSLLTFWMAGEWIAPGQTVRVDFGAPETASGVVLETSPTQWGIRLKLDGQDAAGAWKELAAAPTLGDAPRPLGLARAAAEELKRRGIDYILVFDGDVGAAALRSGAALWGVREAGRDENATLYKLP